jgi:hypothetical protein
MQAVGSLVPPDTSLHIHEGYFFSYRRQDIEWQEHAAIFTGKLSNLGKVAAAAWCLGQKRFVCEAPDSFTRVYNLDSPLLPRQM